jgi:hypothetical protein
LAILAVNTVFAKKSTGKNILFVLCAGAQLLVFNYEASQTCRR